MIGGKLVVTGGQMRDARMLLNRDGYVGLRVAVTHCDY